MSAAQHRTLLSPGKIGPLELKNRMIVTAMGVNFAESDGSAGDKLIAYHEAQAQGGVGLVITGATGVALPVGRVQRWQVGISEDRFLPGLQRLARAVQRHGAKAAVTGDYNRLKTLPANAIYTPAPWPMPPANLT
ncbi:MAG: hypothetical protein NWR12_03540 [Haliea sp.]|nr:hypothetical protein [Haliea sp.]